MTPDARRLVLIRHARAENFAAEDQHRALTDRGRRDAVEAGLWLAGRGVVPDHAFVSVADRAVGTWEALARGLRTTVEATVAEGIYSGGPEAVLDLLRTASPDHACVAVVGHNPTVAYLAHLLDDGSPDPAAFREMSEGYPTAGVTVLDVHVPWAEVDAATARIAAFHVGHG